MSFTWVMKFSVHPKIIISSTLCKVLLFEIPTTILMSVVQRVQRLIMFRSWTIARIAKTLRSGEEFFRNVLYSSLPRFRVNEVRCPAGARRNSFSWSDSAWSLWWASARQDCAWLTLLDECTGAAESPSLECLVERAYVANLGDEGWKTLTVGPCFLDNSRENNGQAPFGTFAPSLYNRYNYAHSPAPPAHMWPSPGPGHDTKCSKTVQVGCSC